MRGRIAVQQSLVLQQEHFQQQLEQRFLQLVGLARTAVSPRGRVQRREQSACVLADIRENRRSSHAAAGDRTGRKLLEPKEKGSLPRRLARLRHVLV